MKKKRSQYESIEKHKYLKNDKKKRKKEENTWNIFYKLKSEAVEINISEWVSVDGALLLYL